VGLDPNTDSILCDDLDLNVTSHLQEGLRNIFAISNCPRLWVDAICINQASDIEKAPQVAKMHHIYRKAKGIYVWLGRAEDQSDEAITAIKDVVIPPDTDKEFPFRMTSFKSRAQQLFDVSLFKSVAALSRRTWFRRLWIAQEYFYSQSVEFLCGTETVDGSKLLQVLNNLSLYSFSRPEPPGYQEEKALFLGFQVLTDLNKVKEMHRGVNN